MVNVQAITKIKREMFLGKNFARTKANFRLAESHVTLARLLTGVGARNHADSRLRKNPSAARSGKDGFSRRFVKTLSNFDKSVLKLPNQ